MIPAVHALHLLELLREWGVEPGDLLEGTALDEEVLADPSLYLDVPTLERLAANAREATGFDGLGILLGMRMRISAHGYLGFAAMTAPTTRAALAVAARYVPIRTEVLGLGLEEEGDRAAIVIDERADLGTARDAVIFALMVGIRQMGQELTGREITGHAEVTFPEPGYYSALPGAELFDVRFEQPANRLVFDASVLDLAIRTADPAAHRLALEQCEQALTAGAGGSWVVRVRSALPDRERGYRSVDDVARELGVSTRTLKRRLGEAGTSYSELLDEVRRQRALVLLRADALSVEETADRLGYAEPASFTRAFKRWTGKTPSAWRGGG